MSQPKTFASLGPTLLARKGAARPAMRPQVKPIPGANGSGEGSLEDLGWNDMGDVVATASHDHEVLPLTPAPANIEAAEAAQKDDEAARAQIAAAAGAKPVVRQQQEAIEQLLVKPMPKVEVPAPRPRRPRKSALDRGKKAAFTLRLDAERHLKLRLASTIRNLSAQQLVTEALDRLLADLPEIESLAAQVKRH